MRMAAAMSRLRLAVDGECAPPAKTTTSMAGRKRPRAHPVWCGSASGAVSATTAVARTLLALLAVTVALSFYAVSNLHKSHDEAFSFGVGAERRLLQDGMRTPLRSVASSVLGVSRRSAGATRIRSRYPLHVSFAPLRRRGQSSEHCQYRFEVIPFSLREAEDLQPGQLYQSVSSDEGDGYPPSDEEGSDSDEENSSDSGDYVHNDSSGPRDLLSEVDNDGCVPLKSWMVKPARVNCNDVMEIDMARRVEYSGKSSYRLSFRVVDGEGENGEEAYGTVKMLELDDPLKPITFERTRRDTKVMERMTSSPYVSNIYGFCSTSQIVDFSSHTAHDLIKEWRLNNPKYDTSTSDRLRIGAQIAGGIADLHTIEGDGLPSIAHNDLSCHEIVRVGDVFKVNNFHLSKLLRKDVQQKDVGTAGGTCLERVPYCMQKICSPEQYEGKATGKHIYLPKADVFAVGNILYYLLTNQWIFEGVSDVDARVKLRHGERSPYPVRILSSSDPAEIALKKAVDMAWVHDPERRPSARRLSDFLMAELDKLEGGGEVAKRVRGSDRGVVRVQNVPEMGEDHRYTDSDFWANQQFGM